MWVIGHVEPRSRAADLLGRRHDRLGAAQDLAHRIAAGNVPERAVFEFAGRPDDRALAVAFDGFGVAAERGDQSARERRGRAARDPS